MSITKIHQSSMTASGQRMTPFGAMENPALLENLPTANVLRVDTLACLKEVWGDNILMARPHIYAMVSGSVSDARFSELLTSYYKRYSAFANYVDEKFLFEDPNIPLVARIIGPVRRSIRSYEECIIDSCKRFGGTYLGNHQDYAYFAFKSNRFPELEESWCLC